MYYLLPAYSIIQRGDVCCACAGIREYYLLRLTRTDHFQIRALLTLCCIRLADYFISYIWVAFILLGRVVYLVSFDGNFLTDICGFFFIFNAVNWERVAPDSRGWFRLKHQMFANIWGLI